MNSLQDKIIYDELMTIPPEQLRLVENNLSKPSEIRVFKTEEQIRSENIYANKLSTRNSAGNYIIQVEDESVLINFIPSRRIVADSDISYFLDNTFQYFTPPVFSDLIPDPISFAEGTIFRIAGEGLLPKESYSYFMIEDGIVKEIPNYKTVEVLLFERNRTLDDIQIIEPSVFDELLYNSVINKLVENGMSIEQATEEVAKFVVTSRSEPIDAPPSPGPF